MTGCGRAEPRTTEEPRDYRCQDCNVILISLDTVSAKHLSSYGYDRETSPNIDRLAEDGVLFEKLMNNGGGTLTSHMSMMTSLYAETHNIIAISATESRRLEDARITLAEQLKDGGFHTAGFADRGWLEAKFGFDQGFDLYDDRHGHFKKILPRAYRWLNTNAGQRFFLFLHTYDAHSNETGLPYGKSTQHHALFYPRYDGYFSGCGDGPCASSLLSRWNAEIEHKEYMIEETLSDNDLEYMKALYDGGITYVDEKFGELLHQLQKRDLYDNSLIILTSDHGEEFLEHGLFLHRQTYREVSHVPLIIKFPQSRFAGVRVPRLAATVDIMPTILEIVGIKPNLQTQGVSLMPLLFGEDIHRNAVPIWGRGLWSRPKLITEEWSVLVDKKTGEPAELYNVKEDPDELNNLYEDYPDLAAELSRELVALDTRDKGSYRSFKAAIGDSSENEFQMDRETVEGLKALGYLQ